MSHHKQSSSRFFPNTFCKQAENIKILKDMSLNKMTLALNQYRKDLMFCDFELRILSKILASASPYFETLFRNSGCFIENSNNYVDIKEVDNPEIMETVLNYIYTGDIEIDSHNVQEIVHVSSILQLTDLINYCAKFLEHNLQTFNCIGILCFSDSYGLSSLCFEAKCFIENNFAEIIKEDEFFELPANLFKSFLKSENLSIISEYQVLMGTIEWILHKPQERLQYLNEFIDIIRMPIISHSSIETLIEKCDHPVVAETLRCYMSNEERCLPDTNFGGYSSVRCKPRMASRRSIYLFGGQGSMNTSRNWNSFHTLCLVEKYNFYTATWDMVKSLMYPRSGHCVVQLHNKLFVIGGTCDSLILDAMEIYDPTRDESSMGPRMNIPRSAFGACSFSDSYIYVFGGLGGGGSFIEEFNPFTNHWNVYDQMPSYRYGMQVIEHDGLIYIIGGVNSHEMITNTVMSYDPETKKFFELAPLNQARESFAACVHNGNYIYVIGGRGPNNQVLNSVEQYNINEDKWSYVTELPAAKSNLCAATINNLIYVYGGQGPLTNPQNCRLGKKVYFYDPEVNQWLTSKPMTQGRLDAAVIVV
ncbi:actin-binding protein ipp-like protein [Dermatophagoides farinae]|uniref:Kelch-like protein diablo n=1 Tax=Dermatophagoides farinae TaxID=6954 RepID=A0A9D4NXJ3_DERFA|nr:actin-binding protein ipp-like protein [Dermatophagoides farinae]